MAKHDQPQRSEWRKSRHSDGNGGNCVEVRYDFDAVRDSKNPRTVLKVDVRPLLRAMRNGEFDR